MAITDELRKWAQICGIKYDSKLYEIADRIDAAHRSALEKLAAQVDESEDGWVRLPVDADGVPIHVGDVMETEDNRIFNVDVIQVSSRKWSIGLVTTLDSTFSWHDADRLRHHRTQTVEDVLREFAEKMNENMGMYTGEVIDADEWRDADRQTIAEFAAKLRMAGDE